MAAGEHGQHCGFGGSTRGISLRNCLVRSSDRGNAEPLQSSAKVQRMRAAQHVDHIAEESASVALGEPHAVSGDDRSARFSIVVERAFEGRTADRRPRRFEFLNEPVPIGLQRGHVGRRDAVYLHRRSRTYGLGGG